MKKSIKHLVALSLIYCFFTFIANFFSSSIALKCVSELVGFLIRHFDMTSSLLNTVSMLVLAMFDLIVVSAVIFIFIRVVLPTLYEQNDSKLWFKKSALMILPGEVLRFAFALTDLGFVGGSGKFAAVPSCLFELLYLKDTEREYAVRHLARSSFADCVVYSLCYVLYLALFFTAVFFICKTVWNVFGVDCEE